MAPEYDNLLDAAASETTRFKIEELRRHTGAGAAEEGTREILLFLYEDEKNKRRETQEELGKSNSQAMKYASDLTRVYREVKDSKRELAETNSQLRKYAVDLRKTISDLKSAKKDLEESYYDTVRRLVIAAEYKDRDTGNHITRISRYSALVAEKIGMTPQDVQTILYASPMHDVGKIGIPDRILLKPGRLAEPEFELMKLHTLIGANILAESKARVLQWAREIAMCHHEKWNGEGYPQGISRHEIPLHARIVSLVDTFDALTSKRPYKEPYTAEIACDIIVSERERHFDPELVDVFLDNMDMVLQIKSPGGNAEHSGPHPALAARNPELERLTQLYR
ncbi:MAG: HD domain-containing protein [Chitinivibrionales bacterium]|nr:HD domain-containing protein [Chitinivibrionales bacterium]MBD3396291.1 HD domain-containing protein [Chitinivibrionales bacterium]